MRRCASRRLIVISQVLTKLNEKRQHERKLPLLPTECLAIEDSPPGIESARAAGMRTLGVTNTVPDDALRAAGAEVVTASLADWTVDAVKLLLFESKLASISGHH